MVIKALTLDLDFKLKQRDILKNDNQNKKFEKRMRKLQLLSTQTHFTDRTSKQTIRTPTL